MNDRIYIDCEFDGHNGPLLSIGMVREAGGCMHIKTLEEARDPWVIENVMSVMDAAQHEGVAHALVPTNAVGREIRWFLGDTKRPIIIADSPVDIARFCAAISTGEDGGWASVDYPTMQFEVHNVDCYPTTLLNAVQHNAWWDAMALREKLVASK